MRAVDDLSERIGLFHSAEKILGGFPRPPYASLYSQLAALGLSTIGVEFVHHSAVKRRVPPDWQCASPRGEFRVHVERCHWSEIRHAARGDRNPHISRVASFSQTYLDLLNLRLFQLSDAYNQTLAGSYRPENNLDHLQSTIIMQSIDAAVHAFLADAGSLRDLIALIVWRFILHRDESVRTLGSFIKKARDSDHPIAIEIIAQAGSAGWLKQLSTLRDEVIHIAPMGSQQHFHSFKIRAKEIAPTVTLFALHYPILTADGSIWTEEEVIGTDRVSMIAALLRYNDFVETSMDGLDYCWRTFDSLVELLARIREECGFRSEQLIIGAEDIFEVKLL